VAGFFRSHTRKGISLDADDLTFFQARFREPHQIALLVRPFATKASTGGIFIWENGKVNGDASCLEFPFRSSELGPGLPPEAAEPKAAAPAQAQPQSSKSATRAQIVPIASRREVSQTPVVEPTPPPAPPPVAAPPAPAATAVVTPPRPAVEEKAPAVPEKSTKVERTGKNDRYDRAARPDRTPRSEPPAPKAAIPAPPAKVEKTERTERTERTPFTSLATPEIEAPAAGGGKVVKLLLAAVAAIALFVGLFVYPGWLRNGAKAPVTAHQDATPLQLRLERANGELLLTWNPDSEAVRNASKAVLVITDGDQKENVDVDLAQLAKGRIVYLPTGRDINFEMQVTGKTSGKAVSESVRMLRPPSPLQDQNAASGKAAAPTAAAKPAAGAVPPGATPNADGEPVPEQTPAPKPAAPLKQFQTASLSQRLRPAATTDMPDAPTVSNGSHAASSAIPGLNMNALAPAPVAPVAPSAAGTSAAAASSAAQKSGGQIQQAVLVYRKDAEYPKIARRTGAKGTVTLMATIGKDGNIKKVRVVSGPPMLQNAASEAVKQWRYRPTLLNGQPVEAETQVLINFVGER
jgi:protein TonB